MAHTSMDWANRIETYGPVCFSSGEPHGIVFAVVEGHKTDGPYPSRGTGTTEEANTARSKAMEKMTDTLKEGIKDTAKAVKRGAEKVKDAAVRGVEKSKKAAVRTAEKVKDTTDRAAEKVKDA